jgi:alpha-tubulin suppressor-like RCC1 family protein
MIRLPNHMPSGRSHTAMRAILGVAIAGLSLACNAIVGVVDVSLQSQGQGSSDTGPKTPADEGGFVEDAGGGGDDAGIVVSPPAVQVVGGFDHTCAKSKNGVVKCWGSNVMGQAGNGVVNPDGGDAPNVISPAAVINVGSSVLGIGDGLNHTCAIKSDRTVACWGYDYSGQLGDGKKVQHSSTPINVSGVTNVMQISGGIVFTCAVIGDGTVKCWGDNDHGQLGSGNTSPTTGIVTVTGLSDAVEVAVGSYHACALRRSGTVSCWGMNTSGQLGTGNTSDSPKPIDVGVSQGQHISAGFNFSCVVKTTGQVMCWGGNNYGQLGNGTSTSAPTPTPVVVTGLTDAVSLGAGTNHACAVRKTGGVSCWGLNDDGQLGIGSKAATPGTPNSTPLNVVGLSNAVGIGQVLGLHSCAINANDIVLCWGTNYYSELAEDSTTQHEYSPVGVAGFP